MSTFPAIGAAAWVHTKARTYAWVSHIAWAWALGLRAGRGRQTPYFWWRLAGVELPDELHRAALVSWRASRCACMRWRILDTT
jgi:hypothetical protein